MALIASPQQTTQQLLQIESFWNLIKASDEAIQYGLYTILERKYSSVKKENNAKDSSNRRSFRNMKGILQPLDISNEQLREEYLTNKYSL